MRSVFPSISNILNTKRLILGTYRCFGSNTSMVSMNLCVLGGGNMAEAIISALSKNPLQNMKDISVYEINNDRLEQLTSKYGVTVCSDIDEGMKKADITFLSVKPQNVSTLAESISTPPKGLLLSIVAGCTIDQLRNSFRTDRIIRSMPNTPAMVLEGMTVWTATKETPKELVDQARLLLSAIGDQIEVKDESYLDMATAVSGSGPAVRCRDQYLLTTH